MGRGGMGRDDGGLTQAWARAGGGSREARRREAEELLAAGHVARGLAQLQALLLEAGVRVEKNRFVISLGIGLRRGAMALAPRVADTKDARAGGIDPERAFVVDLLATGTLALAFLDGLHATNFQTRHIQAAQDLGDPERLARALALDAIYIASRGPSQRASSDALRARVEVLAAALGTASARGWAAVTRGLTAFFEGRFADARAALSLAEVELVAAGAGPRALATARVFLLWSLGFEGRVADLAREGPRVAALAAAHDDVILGAVASVEGATLPALARDRPDDVHAAAEGALARFVPSAPDALRFTALMARCHAWIYQGSGRAALSALDDAWSDFSRALVLSVQVMRIDAWFVRGRAALLVGERALAEAAVAALRAEDAAWAQPLALALEASLAPRREQRVRLLAETATRAEACNLVLWSAAARVRLGELGDGFAGDVGLAWMADNGVVDAPAMTRFALGELRTKERW